MKVKLRWVEEQLVIVEYQEIEISTDEYPQLTEQIYDLANSEPGDPQMVALSRLEDAMMVCQYLIELVLMSKSLFRRWLLMLERLVSSQHLEL